MRQRTDPLVPVLAAAVSALVVGSVALVFYPRLRDLIGPEAESVVGAVPDPEGPVPVWVCHAEPGVALMIEPVLDDPTAVELGRALRDGPWHFLRLTVHNFTGPATYSLNLPSAGYVSPEGGTPARPARALLRDDADPQAALVLRALGLAPSLRVEVGHQGQALLVIGDDPAGRTAFVSGTLRFERREVARRDLAAWLQKPDLASFEGL